MNATPTTAPRGRRYPGDEGLHVLFTIEALESEFKSKLEGRPIFDDVEMIEIRVPGDAQTLIKQIVSDEYKGRFPDEYSAFKNNTQLAVSGTPLEHWALLKPSQIAQLKHSGVTTVEALAGLSDAHTQQFMGGVTLRDQAKSFLKAAADTAIVDKQEAALAELRAEIAALKTDKKSK